MLFKKLILIILIKGFLFSSPELLADSWQISTEPALKDIIPDQTLVTITLTNKSEDQGIKGSYFEFELLTPKTHPLFTTDFPHVEGKSLIKASALNSRESFQFKQVFPIRGNYELLVKEQDSDKIQVFELNISENPEKIRHLSVFLMALLSFCFCSGFLIAMGPRSKMSHIAILVLCFIPFGISQRTFAHGGHSLKLNPQSRSHTSSESYKLELSKLSPSPRVGDLTEINAFFTNKEGAPVPAKFVVTITQLEHQNVVFETESIHQDGRFHWMIQFFDGSPHKVTVRAQNLDGNNQVTLESNIDTEVEARQPPTIATVKSFGFLMTLATSALMIGVALAMRRRMPSGA